jgi:fibronectin type 3 domain-containing protein
LTWTTVSGATSYNIYRSTSTTPPSSRTHPVSGGSTNSFIDTGLTTGMRYHYWITAVNSAGESSPALGYIGFATPVTIATTVPSAPTGVTAERLGVGGVLVSWSPMPNAAAVIEYELQRSTNGSTWSTDTITTFTGHASTNWHPPTTAYFRVRARNSVGWGPYSSPVSVILLF